MAKTILVVKDSGFLRVTNERTQTRVALDPASARSEALGAANEPAKDS